MPNPPLARAPSRQSRLPPLDAVVSPSAKTARFAEISDAPLPPTALPPTLPPPRSPGPSDPESPEGAESGTKAEVAAEAPGAPNGSALEGGAREVQTDTKAAEPETASPIDPVEVPGETAHKLVAPS